MGKILEEVLAGKIAAAVEVAGNRWHSHFVAIAGPMSAIEVLRVESCASKAKSSLVTVDLFPYLDEAVHRIELVFAGCSFGGSAVGNPG